MLDTAARDWHAKTRRGVEVPAHGPRGDVLTTVRVPDGDPAV